MLGPADELSTRFPKRVLLLRAFLDVFLDVAEGTARFAAGLFKLALDLEVLLIGGLTHLFLDLSSCCTDAPLDLILVHRQFLSVRLLPGHGFSNGRA